MRLGVCLAILVLGFAQADDDSARLLASKQILNEMLVQSRDITVEYRIFNTGGR